MSMEFEEGEYLVSLNDDMMRKIHDLVIEDQKSSYNDDDYYTGSGILAALKTARRLEDP